jgi:hypothetical protein
LLHTKSVIATVLACLLVGGLAACGSGDESTTPPRDSAKELAHWYKGVEAAVSKMEQKQRGFTQFKVDQPPTASSMVKLSPAGAKAGEAAKGAADQLETATTLSSEEAADLYCYFFAFYVDLPSSPAKDEFEVVIDNLVKARRSSSSSTVEIRESADALREAMIEAENAGGRGPEVAAALFC